MSAALTPVTSRTLAQCDTIRMSQEVQQSQLHNDMAERQAQQLPFSHLLQQLLDWSQPIVGHRKLSGLDSACLECTTEKPCTLVKPVFELRKCMNLIQALTELFRKLFLRSVLGNMLSTLPHMWQQYQE